MSGFDDAALLDALYDEDRLYEPNAELAGRELPPRPWRVQERAVDELLTAVRAQLDRAWQDLRERARRERLAAAFEGAFERRAEPRRSRRSLLARLCALEVHHGRRITGASKLDTVDDDTLAAWVGSLESACNERPAPDRADHRRDERAASAVALVDGGGP